MRYCKALNSSSCNAVKLLCLVEQNSLADFSIAMALEKSFDVHVIQTLNKM